MCIVQYVSENLVNFLDVLQVDMWGVGCLLVRQVFGFQPFAADTKFQVVTAIGNILGRRGMDEYIRKYDFDVREEVCSIGARVLTDISLN